MLDAVAGSKGAQEANREIDFARAGPGTPGGIFLRKFWQPICVSSELAVGKAKPIHVMGEKFTLYRGHSGAPYVVGFRCSHRLTQLSTGWVKDDSIQCMYHGWAFDGGGRCVFRPGEDPSGPAPAADINSIPAKEHAGLIYGYFGTGEPPSFPPFPNYAAPGIIENFSSELPCNWFQTYENHIDEVHVAFVHSFGGSHSKLGRGLQLPEINAYETPYGMVRETKSGEGNLRATLYLFPNTMRIIIPSFNAVKHIGSMNGMSGWRDAYVALVPRDDESHTLYITQLAQVTPDEVEEHRVSWAKFQKSIADYPPVQQVAADILAGKYSLYDVLDHPLLVIVEDAVAQSGQGAIADRVNEHLGRTDVGIVRMRRLFAREYKAILEGRPTKNWVYSGEPPIRGF
jgi:5,5'-dehydrodivanillate O-demethylase